jgi:hypothetical protein
MKKLSTFFYCFTLFLGLTVTRLSAATSPENLTPSSVSNTSTLTTEPSLCTSCDDNKLKNWSFESGSSGTPTIWKTGKNSTSSVDLDQNSTYKVCGSQGATFSGNGYFYQDVDDILPGSVATLKIYGARHDAYSQKFQVIFMDASNTALATKSVTIDKDVDVSPWGLKLYTIVTDAAPANTTKIRVQGTQNNNSAWIKVDAACLTVAYCEDCANNKLTNAGFESGLTGWSTKKYGSSSVSMESSTLYKVCGAKGATFGGNGYFYQEVAASPGNKVSLKIWGARHDLYGQEFQLVFMNAANLELATYKTGITKDVETAPWGLQKYTIDVPFAPEGTTKVSVRGSQTNSSAWIKVDQACLTIEDPCSCGGNKLVNGSFESGATTDWSKSPDGTLFTTVTGTGCGTKFGVITNTGGLYQSFAVKKGSLVDLIIWGGTSDASKTQKFKLSFYNSGGTAMNSAADKSVEVDAVYSTVLSQYTLNCIAPDGAATVRLELVNTTGTSSTKLYIDAACLKITTDGALPVTLIDFTASRERSSALLSWSTTSETNASEFEVQQSSNGKSWATVGFVAARGESGALVKYQFTHAEPGSGQNLYRLKMIDLDNTFAFSRMVSVNFEGTESVQVYPNPTSNYIKVTMGHEKIEKVQLYNLQGSLVIETRPDATDIVDLTRLTPGSYVVKIRQANGTINTKRIQVIR